MSVSDLVQRAVVDERALCDALRQSVADHQSLVHGSRQLGDKLVVDVVFHQNTIHTHARLQQQQQGQQML